MGDFRMLVCEAQDGPGLDTCQLEEGRDGVVGYQARRTCAVLKMSPPRP